jgi:hypothetical protein
MEEFIHGIYSVIAFALVRKQVKFSRQICYKHGKINHTLVRYTFFLGEEECMWDIGGQC